jgi:hypothetical protein
VSRHPLTLMVWQRDPEIARLRAEVERLREALRNVERANLVLCQVVAGELTNPASFITLTDEA